MPFPLDRYKKVCYNTVVKIDLRGINMKGYQPKKSNEKQTPPNEGSSVMPPLNINSEDVQNTATGTGCDGNSTTVKPPMSYGWVCPKCGRVNAPWKDHCDCDGGSGPIWKFDYDHPHYKDYYELPKGPTKPYEWGDTPGWWNQGPTCEIKPKEGKFVYGIEYPDGHIEKCPSNYFAGLGDSIPCTLTPGDPNFGRSTTISTKISTQTGGDPNIKAYN